MKRVCSLIAVPLLALGVGACASTVSTTSFKGEAHAVAQRISNFQSDVTAVSEKKLCGEDFARSVRAKLSTGGSTCEEALKRQLGSIDDYELTVEKISVTGSKATALVKSTWSGKLGFATLQLIKEGGGWKIAALG
jgi:hypothetical protein